RPKWEKFTRSFTKEWTFLTSELHHDAGPFGQRYPGNWEVVRNVLVTGEIPRWTKEVVFVAISKDRQCQYCAAAHLACCRMLGAVSRLGVPGRKDLGVAGGKGRRWPGRKDKRF